MLVFKSYYVVWKRYYESVEGGTDVVFKSYYVVWKLICHIFSATVFPMFKSYYVVWKLSCIDMFGFAVICLNRTM